MSALQAIGIEVRARDKVLIRDISLEVTPGEFLAVIGPNGAGKSTLLSALAGDRQLSAGQKRRLALARIWLSPAPLWLLDEPYANLDLDGINLVNRMISAHLRSGGAALVTTHGAYAAPPVQTRLLRLSPAGEISAPAGQNSATAGQSPALRGGAA